MFHVRTFGSVSLIFELLVGMTMGSLAGASGAAATIELVGDDDIQVVAAPFFSREAPRRFSFHKRRAHDGPVMQNHRHFTLPPMPCDVTVISVFYDFLCKMIVISYARLVTWIACRDRLCGC